MAEETTNPAEVPNRGTAPAEPPPADPPAAPKAGGGKTKLMIWLGLCVGVAAIGSTAGLLAGGLLGRPAPASAAASQPAEDRQAKTAIVEEFSYFEFDPIVVNLDERRLDRYVRTCIVLAFDKKDSKPASSLVEKKRPEIKNYLTLKLSGCSLEDVRGEKSLNRLRREVMDSLNEQLWPNEAGLIHHVLFKEFAVQ